MGTRNLVMVVSNKETKVAQYGQWDGYPSGVGIGCLNFLHSIELPKFKEIVDKVNWLTDEQIEMINKSEDWKTEYPYLSRDSGDEVLRALYFGLIETRQGFSKVDSKVEVIGLQNNEEFAKDGLFCEWAYVIDLDKEKFEIYCGYSKSAVEGNRFGVERNEDGYIPVQFVHEFDLKSLPSKEEFLAILEPQEEEK